MSINSTSLKLFSVFLLGICLNVFCADDYYKKSPNEESQKLPQHSPLGFLGASGIFQAGYDTIRVKFVDENGIADKGGLQKGDVIIAANGKKFDKTTVEVDDGGKGPREDLGMAIDDTLKTNYKILELTVLRGEKSVQLKLNLSPEAPFSDTYPFYCAKSDRLISKLSEKLLELQLPIGAWHNNRSTVMSSIAGLSLLATGDKRYMKAIKRTVQFLLTSEKLVEKDFSFSTWTYVYSGTFLCEYYLATGDKKVLEKIKYISDVLAFEGTSENGRHAHKISMTPDYDGNGLNILSSHVLLFWALAEKCGYSKPQKQFDAVLEHLKKSTHPGGCVNYFIGFWRTPPRDSSARTGLAALALNIAGIEKKYQKIYGDYLEKYKKRMGTSHANATMGMIWGSAALACINPKGYRLHMDYWRWYMHLGATPQGHKMLRYYMPSKVNCYSDEYFGYENISHATTLMMLAISRKKLFVHGNRKRNWYNESSGEPVIQFYSKIYKEKEELLDFLFTKKEELANHQELQETLKYLVPLTKGMHKDKAQKLYEEIVEVVKPSVSNVKKLALIKPATAYKYYHELKKSFRYSEELNSLLKTELADSFKDKRILTLIRLNERYEQVLTQKNNLKLNMLNQLREDLVNNILIQKKNKEESELPDLNVEIQLLIEDIDASISQLKN